MRRKWDNGTVIRALHAGENEPAGFPMRIQLLGPATDDITARYAEVVTWARDLARAASSSGWRLATRRSRIPGLGTQELPVGALVDTRTRTCDARTQAAVDADLFAQALDDATTKLGPSLRQLAMARPHDV